MAGWKGKTVYVDLSSEAVTVTGTDEKLIRMYLGGRGLGIKLLSELADPDINPLSPENPLIFTAGPLTGLAPMASGAVLTSKSPLTGTIFSWNMGGGFGRELKKAGIDALVITGKAKKPSFVEVRGEDIKIVQADHLWGKNIEACTEALKNKGSVACIGRAGEKGVLISSFVIDSVHSGRGGLGAVAGSKLLKAMVVKGEKERLPASPEKFKDLETKMLKLFEANPVLSKGLANYGTPSLVKLLDYMDLIPCKNFSGRGTTFADLFSGEYIKTSFELEKESCPACPLGCKRRIIKTGQILPDYDSLWAFGFNLENPDFNSVLRADRICKDYGLDPISAGSVLGACAELKSGKIDLRELETLLEAIGGGSEPGNGARKYFSARKREYLSMDVKGLELGGFDPRGIRGQALAYATSCHGGDYFTAFMVGPEVLGKPLLLDRFSLKGKAGILQVFENLTAVLDSLVLCPFSIFAINEELCSALLHSGVGMEVSPAELLKSGERIWNLEKIYNLRAGFTRKDDALPERFFEAGSDERGDEIPRQEFEVALQEYYRYRGWDTEGVPSQGKLRELGLGC
ncbi:aldehyde:ferredoxin oxidoreductase [Methanosarcina sp. 2.H.T.1A.6]|uniref:aldehyde ferredoxin oxidoreductase family protein n=1 Tax=unclassified Methanosarcina TaxID=2644672 RepID=UPI000620FC03|nr:MULTISPECIES: aldehyde ferredoxin oxidoreductase family protein [unclassified Methanosarcina]KKG11997.1 aldehyde:ferredoxin oxidoreductase [Methanosarcina sp. 2.H.T.1A.15]KKG14260.1 aldehyde:ferredoxin oxidoreductase [Methanosarcina sp. 2.H.T.1A.3]KKG19750.1 aldehyde:ferredoxin oxidoreductase [Methanosarcina sp. 2.H.T.1A.6]KKG27137.1 aldehyde:ferredoxin oxidoreductase [Methanosarcina sp. 2.H.T.1A.8]